MKYIKSINEYRNQLEIPFDDKHPLHDKPTHVHIVDSLLALSNKKKSPELYTSTANIKKLWDDNVDNGFKVYKSNDDIDIYLYTETFIKKYPPTEFEQYYTSSFVKEFDDFDLDSIDDATAYNILSQKGQLEMFSDEFMRIMFDTALKNSNVLEVITKNINNNGLLPIWRAISYQRGEFSEVTGRYKDVYEVAVEHNGIGIYWTFVQSKAHAYWSKKIGEQFVIHAYVKPEYINWPLTIFKSAWDKNNEKEIEVKENVEVLIYKVTDESGVVIPLKKELVVKV